MTRFKPTPGASPRPAPSALENLYRSTSTWLVARLRRRFGETLAEDIAQEAYVRMSRIDMDDVRHPKALLLKVAVNAGLSQTRRAASRGRVANLALECDAAEIDAPCPSEQDEAQLLKEIILGLPPLYRDVFLLSQFAGMPYDLIAAQLGISVATVKRRLAKAIALCTAHFRD